PSRGLFTVGKAGYLPPFFQKTNKAGIQKNILYVQGGLVTILGLLFVVLPSVQSFYQILSQLTVILYLVMYLLMFAAAIYLRYTMKTTPRPFVVGRRSNFLIWVVGGVGFLGSLLALVLSFIMPTMFEGQISTSTWWAVLIGGTVLVIIIPFVIYSQRKASWKSADTDFAPFHFQNKTQKTK
ncbi:MAG: amino acid permease, partial [Mucinivorans sp.]